MTGTVRKTASAGAASAGSDSARSDLGAGEPWVGQSIERFEDDALLRGRGTFADDAPVPGATAHAAFVRSPHAHASITGIDCTRALALEGVLGVLTGEDMVAMGRALIATVKADMDYWPLAVERARYVGEPVAVVIAENRYLAEDAAEQVSVDYEPLPAVVDPIAAAETSKVIVHPRLSAGGEPGNVCSDRTFVYGEPDAAFDAASHQVSLDIAYPRSACTPMECFVVVASHLAEASATDAYDVFANFNGPFSLHPIMARSLRVPANRLRLRTPADSGGSFGVKQGVFPYIVALCFAAKVTGRPVKWVEDRLEHLQAANSATNRVTRLRAAVAPDGRIHALEFDQLDDCGAYLRAPEPASLYRTHGHLTGAYDIEHLRVRNRVVLTNKAPSGLNRGFGGPQVYFALERLVQRIAVELGLDSLAVIARNLVRPEQMPYRTASGGLLDSGDYPRAVAAATRDGGLAELARRRERARAEGRLFGIGYAAVVEPSISNMGYITTVLTPEARERSGPKDGGAAAATVSVDPSGSVNVTIDSVPQGQGHRTAAAQVVADVLGLLPADIRVHGDLDTASSAWTISAGNYSSRFAGAVAGAVHLAAERLRARIATIAAAALNTKPDALEFAGGEIRARDNPDNRLPFARLAGGAHWSVSGLPEGEAPGLRETVFWSCPELEPPDAGDRVNSSATYGFIFDFCAVEVDPGTCRVQVHDYVTMHDAGRLINPALVEGQIRGGFAHAVGATFYEELRYGADGEFLAGTFADYLVPTAHEVPPLKILHQESPSPFTPLGAKGVGEGNCMSTPVCLANAVADALGIADIALPLTPDRIASLLEQTRPEPGRPASATVASPASQITVEGAHRGEGEVIVAAESETLWHALHDVSRLAEVLPGCESLAELSDGRLVAVLTLGVGPVRGRFESTMRIEEIAGEPHRSLLLEGTGHGPLGAGRGRAVLTLVTDDGQTRVVYRFGFDASGKVAAVGGRMLEGTAHVLARQLLARLARTASPVREAAPCGDPRPEPGWLTAWVARLLRRDP